MPEKIGKILWATDFSEEAEDALRYARFFADRFEAEIVGLHVIPEFSPIPYNITTTVQGDLVRRVDVIKADILTRLRDFSQNCGIPFTPRVEDGGAAKKIVETAENEKADLIVMGKRGESLVEKLLIGSVANHVLRHSSVPLLLVRKTSKEPGFKKILVPTDFSDFEEVERDYAVMLGAILHAELMFLHVLALHNYEFPPSVVDELLEGARRRLADRPEASEEGVKAKDDVIRATEAAAGITDYVEANDYDLIVMSTCGPGRWERFFLGSTTEKVISHSPVPVFAIPSSFCRR